MGNSLQFLHYAKQSQIIAAIVLQIDSARTTIAKPTKEIKAMKNILMMPLYAIAILLFIGAASCVRAYEGGENE